MLELRPTCENCNKAASSGLARCAHLYLRMHLLRGLRRECFIQCLSELRRRICSAPDQASEKLARRHLSRKRPGEYYDKAQTC